MIIKKGKKKEGKVARWESYLCSVIHKKKNLTTRLKKILKNLAPLKYSFIWRPKSLLHGLYPRAGPGRRHGNSSEIFPTAVYPSKIFLMTLNLSGMFLTNSRRVWLWENLIMISLVTFLTCHFRGFFLWLYVCC